MVTMVEGLPVAQETEVAVKAARRRFTAVAGGAPACQPCRRSVPDWQPRRCPPARAQAALPSPRCRSTG